MRYFRRVLGDPDVAIDLGTANTRVFVNGKGLLADEPTVVRLKASNSTAKEIGVGDPLHAVINGSREMLLTGIQTDLWQ